MSPFLYLLTFLMSFTSLLLKLTDLSLAFDFWWYHSLVAILCDWINLRSCNVLLSCGHAPQRWLIKLFVLPTVLFRDLSLRFCTLKYWLSPWLLPPSARISILIRLYFALSLKAPLPLIFITRFRLLPFRSPLLRESIFLSFPPGT